MTEGHWIFDENLKHCLSLAASEFGVGFDDDDWTAVHVGLRSTSDVDDRWFGYTLANKERELRFECALDDGDTSTGIVHIRFLDLTDSHDAARLSTVLGVCVAYTFSKPARYIEPRDNKTLHPTPDPPLV